MLLVCHWNGNRHCQKQTNKQTNKRRACTYFLNYYYYRVYDPIQGLINLVCHGTCDNSLVKITTPQPHTSTSMSSPGVCSTHSTHSHARQHLTCTPTCSYVGRHARRHVCRHMYAGTTAHTDERAASMDASAVSFMCSRSITLLMISSMYVRISFAVLRRAHVETQPEYARACTHTARPVNTQQTHTQTHSAHARTHTRTHTRTCTRTRTHTHRAM